MPTIDDVVFFSGGVSSWAAAKRVAEKYGTDHLKLLFTDTLIEDEDLYRFLREAAEDVGGELVWIKEGRTPWEVFRDVRMLGNSRVDPCSRILKREIAKKWVHDNYPDPETVRLWLGMNWDEEHRLTRAAHYWEPYKVGSLLMESPWLIQQQLLTQLTEAGIEMPRLYTLGFPHNNCGGGCIKAGHAHFRHLLNNLPEVYAEWEKKEQEMRDYLQRDVAILRDRSGGKSTPLTLKQLRHRQEKDCDLFDWGGCGCFAVSEEEEE
jgi:uncharacterized protein (DUF736 family)